MKTGIRQVIIFGLIAVLVLGGLLTQIPACQPEKPIPKVEVPPVKPTGPPVMAPAFNADSAFYFVKKQVDFGPRVPGTPAHKKCAAWLVQSFRRHGLTVIEQNFKAKTYFATLDAVNIIAQYKPELANRIIVAAHWDSRHVADKDTKNTEKPILGADDGASGVGILLELARMLQANGINIGVDLICFDAEDLGKESETSIVQQVAPPNTEETWCLGSQYWAANLHRPGYRAQSGILLDMVGAKGAQFPYEMYSTMNAGAQQAHIWSVAKELGFEAMFPPRAGAGITDDHVFVMKGTAIPMVDIINMSGDPFGSYHHTHADNMSIIDKTTLQAVGQVVATVIYRAAKPL